MPHRLNAFIEANPNLHALARTVGQVSVLQRHFQTLVPASLGRSCRVAHYADGRLTLAADNGAVAGKLRQLVPQLISSFLTMGCEVTGIQIRVQASNVPPPGPTRPRTLGKQGRQTLEDFTRQLQDGDPLKLSLQRMVKRAK
ncbi:MAG: hypothetical protein Fur0026_08920 [Sideroxydans sp.]